MTNSLFLLLSLTYLISCSNSPLPVEVEEKAKSSQKIAETGLTSMKIPAQEVTDWPNLFDDLDYDGLQKAMDRQFKAFKRRPLRGTLEIGGKSMPLAHIEKSLKKFRELFNEFLDCRKIEFGCEESFHQNLRDQFRLYRAGKKKGAHFTAYYSPTFNAKRVASPGYQTAIYKKPSTEELRRKTRNEILFEGALSGLGLELFWIEDPFELYLLQIEGGGRIKLEGEKKFRFVSYEGTNSQRHRFISRYMKEQGYIDDLSVKSQRAFLKNNPEKWEEIYAYNPSFVYFTESKTEPLGLESIPLTQDRSLAQDRKIYKRKGLLSFVVAKRPFRNESGNVELKSFSRFYIDQDTGGAIRGEARADLYFGFGEEAELAANHLNLYGSLYFLVLR